MEILWKIVKTLILKKFEGYLREIISRRQNFMKIFIIFFFLRNFNITSKTFHWKFQENGNIVLRKYCEIIGKYWRP